MSLETRMRSIINTLWSTQIQTAAHLKIPLIVPEHTTLNEKFDIYRNQGIQPNELPSLKAFTIGDGGHRAVVGQHGRPLITPIDHQADHAALYNHLPFVLRTLDNDLSPTEREKYALRKEVEIEGRYYYAYYARRLNLNDVAITLKRSKRIDGEVTSSTYVPTSSNLSPTPPDMSSTGVVTTSGEYLSSSAIVNIRFSKQDVSEFTNVARILYNDEIYAVISEIALCTGVDRTVQGSSTGGQINYRELIAAQVSAFVPVHYEMVYHSEGFDFGTEVGAVEPLLGSESVGTSVILDYTS